MGCLPSRHQPALVEVLQAAKPGTGVAWPSVAPLCAWRTEVKCHARVLTLATILVCRLAREQSFSCKGADQMSVAASMSTLAWHLMYRRAWGHMFLTPAHDMCAISHL